MSEEELELLEQHLKDRSRKFMKLANFSLCFIAGIIIIGILLYFYGGKFVISKSLHLNKEKVEIINQVERGDEHDGIHHDGKIIMGLLKLQGKVLVTGSFSAGGAIGLDFFI